MSRSIVLVLGSAPRAIDAASWERGALTDIVAINNAWRVREDWDYLVHPDDFPEENWPPTLSSGQSVVRADAYIPVHNDYGGMVYAGGTMAFTAGYWALGALRPDVLAYFGCDMVYVASGNTHFYGNGAPDPLRDDITLRSLEAKSARLMLLAAQQGCACVNLSKAKSRLIFPRCNLNALAKAEARFSPDWIRAPLAQEDALDYRAPDGKYWKQVDRFDPDKIDALDALWLAAGEKALA